MENDATFQYLKLVLDYVPFWSVLLLIFIVWVVRKPEILNVIPKYVSSAKIGEFEVELRQVTEKLEETETQVAQLEEENLRLNSMYAQFDAHAPVAELAATRQSLKTLAGNIDDLAPVLGALEPGASPADVYAAAEILRQKRDFSSFDALTRAVGRIAKDDQLENLRYHTVWTLASAVHRTVLAAVKHSGKPQLTRAQLAHAQGVMQMLHDNPHVQLDRPDAPNQGIRGPATYALNWIGKGLQKWDRDP